MRWRRSKDSVWCGHRRTSRVEGVVSRSVEVLLVVASCSSSSYAGGGIVSRALEDPQVAVRGLVVILAFML